MKVFSLILFLVFSFHTKQTEEYPRPKTEHLLFFIQRNHNSNTIVYDANFDKNGNLNKEKPIDAYWIRFDEEGQRMELRSFEKWMVYGIKCQKTDNKNYDFSVKLSASNKLQFWLKQTEPFKADIVTIIDGKESKLDHLFATLDESGLLPKVKYGEFFGVDVKSGQRAYHKVFPKDIK